MKNKKGFTLVELIGVVILIGIITLIAVPSVDYIINKTKENAYEGTVKTLMTGLHNWVTDNKELVYEDGTEILLTLTDLKEQGYVEFDIKNPKTGACLANIMQFKIRRVKNNEKDKYEYDFIDEGLLDGTLKDCEALAKTPSIYLLGDNPQKIEIENDNTITYESLDPGAVAKSSNGDDMSASIIKTNNVNLNILSKDYHAKYTVIENGISKTITRKVHVVDTTPPELNVPEDLKIGIGETLNLMEGVTATDNSGVAPTIKTSGTVNFDKEGEYKVIYIASDKSGNSVSKERKITVIGSFSYLETYAAGIAENGFRSSSYAHKIISISFIDNDDVPDNAVATWDLSEAKDKSITGWIVESASNKGYYNMYIGSEHRIKANINSSYWFWHLDNLFTINFDNYDTSDVENMAYMFSGYGDMFSYDVPEPLSISVNDYTPELLNEKSEYIIDELGSGGWMEPSYYYMCSSVSNLDLSSWDTSKVRNMSYMFSGMCYNENLDLSSFDTSNVEDMSYMFAYSYYLEGINFDGWDTSNVTDMSYMFSMVESDTVIYESGTQNLKSLDVSHFDTSSVTDMSGMFEYIGYSDNLVDIDLSNWNTSNVLLMTGMFDSASIKNLDLSSWNVEKVINFGYMFYYITTDSINISNWNFANTNTISTLFYQTFTESINADNCNTSKITNMTSTFSGTSAKSLGLKNWDTSNVTNMRYMFSSTYKLESLDLSHFNVDNVIDMEGMFYNSKAKNINLSGWNTSNVTDMSDMFRSCILQELDVSHFNISKVTDLSGMFQSCINLTSLDLSSLIASLNLKYIDYMFYGTTNLKTIKTFKNVSVTTTINKVTSYDFAGSDGNTYAAGTFPTGNTESITLTR